MKISEMSREELEGFVKAHCALCKKNYPPFVAGEYYVIVEQDQSFVTLDSDDRAFPFTYEEMNEHFYTTDEREVAERQREEHMKQATPWFMRQPRG